MRYTIVNEVLDRVYRRSLPLWESRDLDATIREAKRRIELRTIPIGRMLVTDVNIDRSFWEEDRCDDPGVREESSHVG